MEAYEFQTAVNDGVIRIPAKYRNKLFGKVKVILMRDDSVRKKTNTKKNVKKSDFPYFAIDTTGYVFNREDANER